MIMKKPIKRAGALLLCVLMCVAAVFSVSAASETITISECDDLQIKLPDNMTAVTRSVNTNNTYFARHKLSYSEVMNDLETANGYLHAMDDLDMVTLILSYNETAQSKEIGSFAKYSTAELEETKKNYMNASVNNVTYNSGTADEANNGMAWLFFDITTDGVRKYRAETVSNGKIITLTLNRNGGDVQPEDYSILTGISATVKFPSKTDDNNKMMMILIAAGAGLVALILIIVLIIVIKSAKKSKKKNDNDKILQELAGKYQTRQSMSAYGGDESEQKPSNDYSDDYEEEPVYEEEPAGYEEPRAPQTDVKSGFDYDLDDFDEDVPDRKYSDADIARLLGDVEDDENFIDALPATEADSEGTEEVRDSVIEDADAISDFFEDEPEEEAAPEAAEAEEPADTAYISEDGEEAAEQISEPVSEEEPSVQEEASEEPVAEKSEELADEEPEEPSSEEPREQPEEDASDDTEANGDENGEDDAEFEEFVNDEVLAREESDQGKFKSSSDFFEEAPRRYMGVISSQEIEEAEEYDVIGEVEQQAEQLEQEPAQKGEGFSGVMKKVGGGLKNFGIHCGYFATNVKRAVKRRRARTKRRKAEEARRRKQMERRRQQQAVQERRRDSNGLVQVHSRDERRPRNDR